MFATPIAIAAVRHTFTARAAIPLPFVTSTVLSQQVVA
jgi:hypothetical protein